MKRFTLILLAVLSFTMFACNNTEPQDEIDPKTPAYSEDENVAKNPACAEIASTVVESFSVNTEDFDYFNFADENARLDDGTISLFYGNIEDENDPDFSHVTDYYLLIPVTTVATEIGIFKVDDAANAEALKQYFSNRTDARATTFAPYNETESIKARNALISSEGCYVWYLVTDSNREIEAKILEMIK